MDVTLTTVTTLSVGQSGELRGRLPGIGSGFPGEASASKP